MIWIDERNETMAPRGESWRARCEACGFCSSWTTFLDEAGAAAMDHERYCLKGTSAVRGDYPIQQLLA